MEKMALKDIADGRSFKDVSCLLKDFRSDGDKYELVLSDQNCTRKAYIKKNLFSFEQMKSFLGKVILISGIHEAGLSGVVKENIKVKNIEVDKSDTTSLVDYMLRIDGNILQMYLTQINQYVKYVGKQVPAYRKMLDIYFSPANIEIMKTMPATHIRQGSPLGGMIHATLAVTDMAYYLATRYLYYGNGVYSFRDISSLNWDLLLTGGLLHLAGNFYYFDREIPHNKRPEGVEQGYSICRQQFITHLIVDNNITISEADLAALLAVMSRLNEQFDGVKKCRQETSFLIKAYETYLEMDSFDREVAGLLKDKFDNSNNNSDDKTHDDIIEELSYEYSDKLSCYVSKAEIIRKAHLLGYYGREEK